jgi:hypothetical protein
MSRITSHGSQIMIHNTAIAAAYLGITSATKAKPCVITCVAGAAPVVGDVIIPRNTGWPSIEGRPFKVITVAAQVITLEDSDTTTEPGAILTSVATPPSQIEKPTWLELCRSTFNLSGPAGATIDITTLCDDAHKVVSGLPALNTWTAAGFYDAVDAALIIARDAYRSGRYLGFDIRFRDGTGVTFMGSVNQMDLTMGINAAVGNNIAGNVDGQVQWYKTPAAGFVVLPSMAPVMAPLPAEPAEMVDA